MDEMTLWVTFGFVAFVTGWFCRGIWEKVRTMRCMMASKKCYCSEKRAEWRKKDGNY